MTPEIFQLLIDLDRAQLRATIAAGAAASLGIGADIAREAIRRRNEITRQITDAAAKVSR